MADRRDQSEIGPALLDLATRQAHAIGRTPFLVGRSRDAEVALEDVACSRRHFQIVLEDGEHFVEPLSDYNPTFCDGQRVVGRTLLHAGAVLRVGQREFQFVAPGQPLDSLPPARQATVVGPILPDEDVRRIPERILLEGEMFVGRDPDRVQICLPHVQVSRVHARIKMQGNRAVLVDLNSANGTFVNGRRLAMPVMVEPGDGIGIGPYTLQFTGDALVSRTREDNAHLAGIRLRCVVGPRRQAPRVAEDRRDDGAKVLLDDVSVVARPREFIAVLGPSGSGKTILLEMLSARRPLDGGRVLLNGQDLHGRFDALKQDLSVVHQRDVLHELLPVEDALRYTARLRLPPDTSAREIDDVVRRILQTVGLSDRRRVPIGKLSGGQRRRASLANELLGDPSLLFLDEVTSGLDEQADRALMRLFRDVAESGKTIFCVTHNLAAVERSCHLVVILAKDGKLAFAGPPWEALEYFGLERLGDVYDRMSEHAPEFWRDRFAAGKEYTRYVADRLPLDQPPPPANPSTPPVDLAKVRRSFLHQFPVLTARYLQVLRADVAGIAGMIGQTIWVAILLMIVFGNVQATASADPTAQAVEQAAQATQLLFLIGLSCFWFGCSNAAKEIVREWTIFQKERRVNLDLLAYYGSKFVVQTGICAVQAILVVLSVKWWCNLPGPLMSQALFMLALAAAGTALGLLISAASDSEAFAATMVPLAMIPQIVLSGIFGSLDGLAEFLGRAVITCYWGYGGLRGLLPDSLVEQLAVAEIAATPAFLMIAFHIAFLAGATLLVLDCRGQPHWGGRLAERWHTLAALFGGPPRSGVD